MLVHAGRQRAGAIGVGGFGISRRNAEQGRKQHDRSCGECEHLLFAVRVRGIPLLYQQLRSVSTLPPPNVAEHQAG